MASGNPESLFGEQDWEGEVGIWGHQIRVDYQGGPEPWAVSGRGWLTSWEGCFEGLLHRQGGDRDGFGNPTLSSHSCPP